MKYNSIRPGQVWLDTKRQPNPGPRRFHHLCRRRLLLVWREQRENHRRKQDLALGRPLLCIHGPL